MAAEADVPEAISVMKGEGEDRYLRSEQFDKNVEQCPPVELTKAKGEPIQHPEMEKPCAVSENVQVESSVLVDSKNNGFGISEGEHFLEPLSDIPQVDQSNQAGLVMEKTQDANLDVGRVELASKYETYVDEHVQIISNEEDSNKENIPCLEKEAESSQKDVEGEEMEDENAGLYRKEASDLFEATTFQDYEAPISNLDLMNDSFKKDTELETNVHKTLDTDPILQEEACLKITLDIRKDSEQTVQKIELEEEPQNLAEVKPEDAKTESTCENEEVIASTEEERAVQTTQEYSEKNEPDLVHSTKENGNISEVFKVTTEEQETEEHALPEIQNAEEETHVSSFKEEEKKGDAKCEELSEVTDTTKETESETVEQRIETSRDLDVPIPEEQAYAAESTKACDQNYSSISEEYEIKTKETIQEDHSAVSGYGLVSEEVGAEAESKELVENNPEEKDLETILIDETAVEVEDHGQAEDGLNSKEIIENEIQTPEDEVEKDLKATEEETNKPVEDTGVACEEKDPAVVLADHPTLKTEEVEVQAEANVDSNDVLERQMPAAAHESEDGSMEVQAENYELVTNTDITSEEKGLESIVTDEGETCLKEAEEMNEEQVKIDDSSHEEKALPIISADETLEVELQAEENVILKENLERQTPTTADEGVTCLKEPEVTILRDETTIVEDIADEECLAEDNTADITPEEKCLATISLDEKVPAIEADEGDKGSKEDEEENKEQIISRDISSEDKGLPTILTDEMAAENEDIEIQADENVDSTDNLESQILSAADEEESFNSKESLEEENPAAMAKGDTCMKEAHEEKGPVTILTDDIAEAIDYAGAQETENSNSKEILEEQIPSVAYEGETDLKEAESEIKEQVETTDIAPIHKDIEYIDEQAREISSKEVLDEQIPTAVDEGALDLKEAEAEIKEEEATDYAPDQKDVETIYISKDETTLEVEDVQEQENPTIEESLESQTPTEAEAETCMKEGEAENMEQFTSAGIAAEDKGLSTILSDEPAKDIEDVQAKEKQIPKEAGEGEEKASHGNINVDDTSVEVYSTEVEAAGPELGVEDEKLEVHPEKNHTIGEEVFDEPKITTRDFSEEQSIEGNATVITPEFVGEDTIKNNQDDEKKTESIKEEIASEISREYIPEDATAQFKDDKFDEILEDSQTVVVDENTTCETTNVEKSEEQFSTLPVKSEESPLVLEKYEPAEEGITKLPEQTKPESSVEDAEVLSYTKEEMQESLDTSVGEACIEEAELSAEAKKENIDDHKTEEVSSSLKEGGVAESSTEQENFETSLQEVEKTKDQEECKETIEGTREEKFETSEDTTEVIEATHIAALENKDNEATDVQEDEYFNSNDNFERQIPTVADEEVEQKLEVEDLPEKNNKIYEEVVDEPNIIGRDLTVTEEIATNPTEEEAVKNDDDDEKVTEKFNEEERSTQNIAEGDVKDISPEYVPEDRKEKYTDCLEEAFETPGEACNEVAELSTEAEKEETVEESSKEEKKEGHEVCEEATEAKFDILEETTEPKPILEEESKKSLDEDYSSSAQESEKEREKEIEGEGEYTSTVRNIDSEVVGGETGLKEANTENEDLVESSHIASEEKENEGTGVYDRELVSATTVEASIQDETVEEEAEPKLEVANESEKSDDLPEKNNICQELLDEPNITVRDFHEEKLTQGSVTNFATESSVEEMVTNCQNETEKVNNEGSSIENTKEGDDGIISTEYAPEDSGEKLKECTQEEVESKEENLQESQTCAPEENIIGSSEVVPESVPESIDEISQDEITAEQTLDKVISKEASTLLSEEKELADSEHEHKNIGEEQAKDGNVPTEEYTRVEETLLPKEEPRELTYSEMAVEKLGDGETEEPIKETCETVPVSEPQSIGLVSKDEIITDQTHCDSNKEPNSSEPVAADTPEEETKDDSAVMTSDSERTSEVSKEEIITQVPVFAEEHETQSVDKNIEEEEVPKEAQVPADEEKPEVISEEPSTLISEEKELVDSEPDHKDIEEEQAKDVDVPTEKDTGVEETLLPKEETRELTFTDMADDKPDAGETEEPTENTSESVLVSEPRSIGLVSENDIITDQTHCDGENEPKGSESIQETVDDDTIEVHVKDESALITKCDSESTDEVSKEENSADQTIQEVVTMEQVSTEEKELKASENEHETTHVDKYIEEDEVPKEEQVSVDEDKPAEEKCLQIEEPKDSHLADQNLKAAETEEEIKQTVETVTEAEPESIIVASRDDTVADQTVGEGITNTPLATAREIDTSELTMEKLDAEHAEVEIKDGREMVSKSDSASIEVVSSDEIIAETKEKIRSPSSALLPEKIEREASEPVEETTAQGTNVQECTKEFEVSADEHNQASLAADSVEEKCLQKEEPSEEITADETLSKEVIDTPLAIPPYTSLHEERELEACELDSEKIVADVPEEETKEGSDVIPQLDSQSSHKVSTESIEEAAEVTSISQESPEATQILDQGEEHTQVETSEVADQIEVRGFQLPEEVKASDNVGLEKLDSDAPEEETIKGSELVPESDCKTIDVAAPDEVIDEQTLDEGITNEQLQIPSSTLLSEEKELRVSEHEATTADKNIEEEQAAEVYVPTEEDKSVEETLFPKEEPRELKVSELALEKLDASETEEETRETSETFLVSEPQSIGAVPDDEIIIDETQWDGEKELKASHGKLDAYKTDEQEVKDDSALVPKCDSVSTDDVSKDEIIAEQTVLEDISREQLQIPSFALLADETMLEASEHEHETTCVDKSIDEVPKEVDVSFDEDKPELIVVAPEKETCLQTEEAKDSESTQEKLEAGKIEDENKETFKPVTQLESESIPVASGEETAGDHNVCEGVVVDTPLSIAREFNTSELHMENPDAEDTEENIKEDPEIVSNIDSGSIKVVSSDEIIAETKEQIQSPSSTLLPEEKECDASEPEDEFTPQDKNTQDCIKEVQVSPDGEKCLQKEELSEVNVSDLALETVSKSDFPSAVAVPSEEITADETLAKEVTDIPLQIPSYMLLHEERELKASELNSEKQDTYIPEEVKERSEVKDEIVVGELQTPSSALLSDEKELKASDSEYEYGTTTNDNSKENDNLKEVEEPTDEATQELYGGRSADLQKVNPSEFEVTEVEGQTEEVKETFETVSNSDFQSTHAVSKDDTTADQTHCDEIKEDSTELALEKQDTDATEEVKEVSEVTPRSDLQSVPAKDEFIADQVLHIPSPALLSEENELKESDHEYGTAIQNKATEKEPAEEIQVTDVEDTEEPRWLKLHELLAENINAGEIEEQTKEASETAPEVSSESIGEFPTEEIADQIRPASLLTEEKSKENTTTTDYDEEKSMNVVEEISDPNEETRELNVSDLEFHSSQDRQKIISTEVHAASNEEKNLEVATSKSRAEDCETTTEANEAAKNDILNEEIKDEEDLPKDSQLNSVDQENIKESQEESEPREERYAEERKEQFNTAPSFKDYEVPEVKLDDTASKYHSPDEAEGIKPSNDTLVATDAKEEKSSESGVETTDTKSAPVSFSECLMDERTKESKEVVTHLTEEKEHADEEEDDHEHVEEAKTDEEKEDTEHNGTSHSSDEPVIVEASRDSGEVKVSPKKSHNILSGMGSKVKHSISKVKKAIIGKSSNSKTQSDK